MCIRDRLRGVTATSPYGDCCSQNGTDVLKWDIPRMSYFLSFAVILSSLCNSKGAQSYKKLPEAIVPKVGHGPKMGQNGFDRACFSVVFLFLLCFIAHLYKANGGTDMEVLGLFRPCFVRLGFFSVTQG